MNKRLFCILLLVMFVAGCPSERDQFRNRLAELEAGLNDSREDQLRDRIARLEADDSKMRIIEYQLNEANEKNQRLEDRVNAQLQAEVARISQLQRGGMVPDIVWQLCLSVLLIVFTVVTVKALLVYFKSGSTNTIVCITNSDSDQIMKIISRNPESIRLLENTNNKGVVS